MRDKIFKRILNYLSQLYPFIWLISLFVASAKTYFNLSIIEINEVFNSKNLFIFTILLAALSMFTKEGKHTKFFKVLDIVNKLLTIILTLIYLGMSYLEYTIWPNFVLSRFHLRLEFILWALILSAMYSLISLTKRIKETPYLKIICILLVFVFASNLFKIGMTYVREVKYMLLHPSATYDEKMKFKVGDFFIDYINFIKENTEEDAKILIPPNASYPWPQTGNGQYIYYFLYPRLVQSGKEFEPGLDLKQEGFDYVLIAWGETEMTNKGVTHGWPKFDVPAEKIIYFSAGKSRTIEKTDYIYSKQPENSWGIIKIKKNK